MTSGLGVVGLGVLWHLSFKQSPKANREVGRLRWMSGVRAEEGILSRAEIAVCTGLMPLC